MKIISQGFSNPRYFISPKATLKDLYDNFEEVKIFGVSKKEEIKNFKEFVKK